MRISAIIPNYNHAAFLEERIRSILSQTRPPDEIILLDDASTDDSLAVASGFDCFTKVLVNEENSGFPFKQWMKGIGAATGDFVWIAESDDSCEPRMLERLEESLEEGSVLAFCRSTEIGPEGNSLGIQRYQRDFFEDFTMDGPGFIRKYLVPLNVIANASSVLFSREAALSVDSGFTEFRGAGDILFWTGIAAGFSASAASSVAPGMPSAAGDCRSRSGSIGNSNAGAGFRRSVSGASWPPTDTASCTVSRTFRMMSALRPCRNGNRDRLLM